MESNRNELMGGLRKKMLHRLNGVLWGASATTWCKVKHPHQVARPKAQPSSVLVLDPSYLQQQATQQVLLEARSWPLS